MYHIGKGMELYLHHFSFIYNPSACHEDMYGERRYSSIHSYPPHLMRMTVQLQAQETSPGSQPLGSRLTTVSMDIVTELMPHQKSNPDPR
jgi:hypothetical protein